MPKTMGKRLRKLKKIRLHHEGKATLLWSAISLVVLNFAILHIFDSRLPFDICIAVSAVLYAILLNFFQCPIRTFENDTDGIVVAPADGKVVVVEETEENEYFHDRRVMVSIFMHEPLQRTRQLDSCRWNGEAREPLRRQLPPCLAA